MSRKFGRVGRKNVARKQVAVQNLSKALSLPSNNPSKFPKVAEGIGDLINPSRSPTRTCMGGPDRDVLLKRPFIPLSVINDEIKVKGGEKFFETIVANTSWGGGKGLAVDNNRVLLSRLNDPTQNYSLIQGMFLRWVRPYAMVIASTPGVAIDDKLSQVLTRMSEANLGLLIDKSAKGKSLALSSSLFRHCSQGIILADDQIFEFGDNSKLAFDYKGQSDLSDYKALDVEAGASASLTIEIGCDVILSEEPDEDITDLIEQAMDAAS